jgi:hypothetical protein
MEPLASDDLIVPRNVQILKEAPYMVFKLPRGFIIAWRNMVRVVYDFARTDLLGHGFIRETQFFDISADETVSRIYMYRISGERKQMPLPPTHTPRGKELPLMKSTVGWDNSDHIGINMGATLQKLLMTQNGKIYVLHEIDPWWNTSDYSDYVQFNINNPLHFLQK